MTEEKFFAAITQGSLSRVKHIFMGGAKINCKDSEGRTPLLKAIEVQESKTAECFLIEYTATIGSFKTKCNNFNIPTFDNVHLPMDIEAQRPEIVKFLLDQNADPNIADLDGRSAFHYAVMSGARGILQILLLNTRTVDNQDKNGQTALHYAIQRNWTEVVDWLVFFGADVKLRDEKGNTAMSLAEGIGSKMKNTVITTFERTAECRLARNLEEVELEGLTIKFGSDRDFSTISTFLLYKCYDSTNFPECPTMKSCEEIWGEITEFILSQSCSRMTLTVNLQDNPGLTEIFFKYKSVGENEQEAIATIKCLPGENWVAVAEIELTTRGWFVICNRPRNENVSIPNDGGKVVSTIDENLVITIPKKSFKSGGQLTITVHDNPPVTKSMKNVISMSRIYDIQHTKQEQPTGAITLTIPLPENYTGKGDLYILSRLQGAVKKDLKEEDKCWSVLDTELNIREKAASFQTKHLSPKVIQESKKDSTKKERIRGASISNKNRGRHSIMFFLCGQPFEKDIHRVIVECCWETRWEKRLEAWYKKDYSCLYVSGCFLAKPRETFGMKTRGNIKSEDDISKLRLTCLPAGKRSNSFQQVELRGRNKSERPNGKIAITFSEEMKTIIMTYLPFALDAKAYAAHSENVCKGTMSRRKRGTDAAGNLYAQEKNLAAELTKLLSVEEVWWKMWLYFGLKREKITLDPSGAFGKMFHMLEKWILSNVKTEDLGIPKLIRVLVMVDKISDAQQVVEYLISCSTTEDFERDWKQSPFLKWVKGQKHFTIEALAAEKETYEPMTDVFLLQIIKHLGTETQRLFLELGLDSTEIETIRKDAGNAGSEFVTFKMLLRVRDKRRHRWDVLESLLKALSKMELNTGKLAITVQIRAWVSRAPKDAKTQAYQKLVNKFFN